MHGCVPVILQDGIMQALESLVPIDSFSIRLTLDDLPNLKAILKAVTPEQYRSYQENLKQNYKAFLWKRELGGLAYNNTISSLQQRLLRLLAGMY